MRTKLVRNGILASGLLSALLVFAPRLVYAQAAGDYQTRASGNWNSTTVWQVYSGGAWINTATPPGNTNVTIQNDHVISYNVASTTIQNLTTLGTGTLNFNAAASDSLTVSGNVTNGGVIAVVSAVGTNSHSMSVGGNFANNGTFTTSVGGGSDTLNVILNGSAAQTISGSSTTTFEGLTFSNTAATISAITHFNVNGTLTVNAGAVFSPAATIVIGGATNTITGSGTILVTRLDASNAYVGQYQFSVDTLTGMSVDYAGTGDQEIDVQVYGSLRTSGSGIKNIAGSMTVNNGVTVGAGTTLDVVGSTLTIIGSTLTVNGRLDFSNSSGVVQSSTLATTLAMGTTGEIRLVDSVGLGPAASAAFQNGTGAWNMNSLDNNGTVEYYGGTQIVTDRNYNNLILSTAGTKTWTRNADRTVNGNIAISGNAAFTLDGNFTLNVGGDWTHTSTGVFTNNTSNDGTVNFNRNGTCTLSRTGAANPYTMTFCNLTISGNTLLDTTDDFVAVPTGVTGCGNLVTNGVFRRQVSADVMNGGGTVSFSDSLTNTTTLQLTQTGGAHMGSTTVIVSGHVVNTPNSFPCGSAVLGGQPVRRYFEINPTNPTNIVATVRLHWRDAGDESNNNNPNDVTIFHCDRSTSSWTRLSGLYTRSGDIAGYNWVELPGVTTFSPFAIGGGSGAPTAASLSSFTASAETPGDTVVVPFLGFTGAFAIFGAVWLAQRSRRVKLARQMWN
jgi:hypothetical protein